jgi:DNA-directed RNA polymerase sigma subunit (sigma70/sigma32)
MKMTIDQAKSKMDAYKNEEKRLQTQILKTKKRLEGAERDVLKRRFAFDLEGLSEELERVQGKIGWARHTIRNLELANISLPNGILKQTPFAALTQLVQIA